MNRQTFESTLIYGGWALQQAADEDPESIAVWTRGEWGLSIGDDVVYLVRGVGRETHEFVDVGLPTTRYARAWRAVLSVQTVDRVMDAWLVA